MKDTNLDKSLLGHPKPLFSLSMTELWERFSFYGIRPLLVLFMAATLAQGGLEIPRDQAAAIVGIFGSCLYLATLPGAWLADNILGQKKAVFIGAIIIALGHLSIALSIFNSLMFFLGLVFIVIGTGLFKTCASVMVGTLYKKDDPRRDSGFTIFYMGINLGAFIAPLICGFINQKYGWHLGFGVGGLGMLVALLIFAFKTIPDFNEFHSKVGLEYDYTKPLQKSKYANLVFIIGAILVLGFLILAFTGFISLDPISLSKKMIFIILSFAGIYFLYLLFFTGISKDDKKSLLIFIILFLAAATFWGAFEQKPTTFNLFAQDFTDRMLFGFEIPAVWFQSLNPLFIIILAPIIAGIWIKLSKMSFEISSITKFGLGVLGAGLGFGIMILASKSVLANNGISVSMLYITISILFLTLGELCLSPVGLSIMSKIAPKIIKNQVMGLWFVASSLGNIIAGLIGGGIDQKNIASLPELFQTCMFVLLGVAVLLFILKPFISKLTKNS